MAYNRWLSPDELEHHGVKGQTWGVTNGPPYPLSRQKRFRTIGPDGRPITSKVAYKKAMKVQRAANRSERRAHPNGTEEDKKEKNSFFARAKRKYRELDKKWAEENARAEAEEQAREEKERSDWEAAKKRLEDSGIPKEEAERMLNRATPHRHTIRGMSWGSRSGDSESFDDRYDDDETLSRSERLNSFIDQYEKRRNDVKEHGTIDEVMKFRDTFTTSEWKAIADRLDAESRVSKYLTNKVSGSSLPSDSKLKDLYLKGTAREVYERRADFTIDQLDAISKRLQAESIIGDYASKQVDVPSKAYTNFKKLSDVLSVAGNSADSISKIVKVFGGSGGGGGKQKVKGPKESNDQKGQKDVTLADIAKSLKGLNDVNKSLEEIKKKLGKS